MVAVAPRRAGRVSLSSGQNSLDNEMSDAISYLLLCGNIRYITVTIIAILRMKKFLARVYHEPAQHNPHADSSLAAAHRIGGGGVRASGADDD